MTLKEFRDVINRINLPDDTPVEVILPYDLMDEFNPLPIRLNNMMVLVENDVIRAMGEISGEDLLNIEIYENEEYRLWIHFDDLSFQQQWSSYLH